MNKDLSKVFEDFELGSKFSDGLNQLGSIDFESKFQDMDLKMSEMMEKMTSRMQQTMAEMENKMTEMQLKMQQRQAEMQNKMDGQSKPKTNPKPSNPSKGTKDVGKPLEFY